MELNLASLYQKMRQNMGPAGWWPADSKEEIIVGAIMIQNTNWQNADRAVSLFRQQTAFQPQRILALSTNELQALVKPAGFYKNKSRAIRNVFSWLAQFNFNYPAIRQQFGTSLRKELLNLHGVGDETADVFLTYIFDVPTFISDKYSRILFTQLGVTGLSDYRSLAKRIELPPSFSVSMAQDLHGLIDEFGKVYFHPLSKFATSFLADDRLII